MKRGIFFVCLILLCSSHQPNRVHAAESSKREVKVEKGKTYTLKKFIKLVSTSYKEYEGKQIYNKLKKNKAVKLSGSGIHINKKRFTIKKTGSYLLKIKFAKKTYKIKMKSVPSVFSVDAGKVSYVKILAPTDGPELKTVEIREAKTVQELIQKMNQTKYRFNFKESSAVRVGFLKYYVELYSADGQKIDQLKVSSSSIGDSEDNTHWLSTSQQAKDVYQFLEENFICFE